MKHNYNWKDKRDKKAFLALEDGSILRGYSAGAPVNSEGEVVFNTGMSGYQEILSDPSYAGQLVTMTYPEIGNYGINKEDMESRKFFLKGFLIHDYNDDSNWRSDESLSKALKKEKVPCLAGIDTRALTLKIRNKGTMKAYLVCDTKSGITEKQALEKARSWEGLDNQDYASKVSCRKKYKWDNDGSLSKSWGICDDELPPLKYKITAFDYGIKWNILRSLRLMGMDVNVVPAKTSASEVLKSKPDGVFFSNGPADPAAVSYAIEAAREMIGKVPMMGICLGHQLLGIACGGQRFRLKFGHHGCNHPVKNLITSEVEITSQNHNFAIDMDSLPESLELTHINLNDNTVEGIRHKKEPMFAVQYHPESSPGPHDPFYLFEQFRDLIENA